MSLIGLGGDFASQHLSYGQILAELLNIVRDNALKLDKILENRDIDNINAEVKLLKEQVTSMNTKFQAINPDCLLTTTPNSQHGLVNTTGQTNHQASVITTTSVATSASTSQQGCVSITGQTSQQTSPITLTSNKESSNRAIARITTPAIQQARSVNETTSTIQQVPANSTTHTNQQTFANTATSPSQHARLRTTNPIKDVLVKHTLTESQQPPVNSTVPTSQQASTSTATPTTVENLVRKILDEYDYSMDWRELKKGLLLALDKNSAAYKQLNGWWSKTDKLTLWYDIGCCGHLELAVVLLEAGLEVNSADVYGLTMLHGSAEAERITLAEYLLDHGADVNLRDVYGVTALIYASYFGDNLAMVKLLVERGAEVNRADIAGFTSLHYAAQRGASEIVKYLVEAGANTSLKTKLDRKTPMDLARLHGFTKVVDLLTKTRLS